MDYCNKIWPWNNDTGQVNQKKTVKNGGTIDHLHSLRVLWLGTVFQIKAARGLNVQRNNNSIQGFFGVVVFFYARSSHLQARAALDLQKKKKSPTHLKKMGWSFFYCATRWNMGNPPSPYTGEIVASAPIKMVNTRNPPRKKMPSCPWGLLRYEFAVQRLPQLLTVLSL
ncbi:hypothetical protein ACFS4T_22565 [Pseudomonas lini]